MSSCTKGSQGIKLAKSSIALRGKRRPLAAAPSCKSYILLLIMTHITIAIHVTVIIITTIMTITIITIRIII